MKTNNIPWEPKPKEVSNPVWRFSGNPITKRNPIEGVNRIFNSAVVRFENGFKAVFRMEGKNTRPYLALGDSEDGIDWNISIDPIDFVDENGNAFNPGYAYDPRCVKVEDTYYIIWCTEFHGAAIGMAKTNDFKTFIRLENPFLPFNRNAVLFPRKVDGEFLLLSRPSDSSHTPFGEIFISSSKDLTYWGKHRHVMSSGGNGWWQNLKIGGGPEPIEIDDGWLLIYHGVTQTCNGYVYSMGGAILDKENPSIVKYRCANFLLTPEEWYEERGFVPNVIFPCAILQEKNRLAIYYGAADSYVALAFAEIDILVEYIKQNNEVIKDDKELGIK